MTIEKGKDWGRAVPRPADLQIVGGDAALAAALSREGGLPVGVAGGDVHRTLGARPFDQRDEVRELPLDLLRFVLDDGIERTAVAHITARRPARRGGWWFGPVLMVMNAQFIGPWHVTSKSHPNDGRAESCEWGSDFGFRDRWQARRRLATNEHVPHPKITTRSFRRSDWTFRSPLVFSADGQRLASSSTLHVEVMADAATVYA